MANPLCEVLLTEAPLALPPAPAQSETGGIVDFWGVVRGEEDGARIAGIKYEAHRAMAGHQLRIVVKEAVDKFALHYVLLHHRVGYVAVGDASLLLRVTSRHRAAAFAASIWIVDELKKRVPIWKLPVLANEGPSPVASTAIARVAAATVPA